MEARSREVSVDQAKMVRLGVKAGVGGALGEEVGAEGTQHPAWLVGLGSPCPPASAARRVADVRGLDAQRLSRIQAGPCRMICVCDGVAERGG
jgi:hypothetical protein